MTGPTPVVGVGAPITAPTMDAVIAALDDTAWISVPSLAGTWTATSAVFYRRKNGVVYLRGAVTGGTGTIFTLPAGYLPAESTAVFICYSSGTTTVAAARVSITSTGAVSTNSGLTPSLSNISFIADA